MPIKSTTQTQQIIQAVLRADAWFDTMRNSDGYAGPVSHWWESCLQYTGAGLDWRYEGIIAAYLTLFRCSTEQRWLDKACRAGDDLIHGQLANGNFRSSSFELNPASGGTPHEAACSLGLLLLAQELHERKHVSGIHYADTAEYNIRSYWIGRLWDAKAAAFRDDPERATFVPNKSATLVEALFLLAELRGDQALIDRYALPTLDAILRHQVCGGNLDGAICQNSFGTHKIEKYLPYYIARCIPALVLGYKHTKRAVYVDAALRAMRFILRHQYEDGSFPQAIYPDGRINRYPQWIAAIGDILRAIELLRPHGIQTNPAALAWMLAGQQPSGGFATAHGFASQVLQSHPGGPPDMRDILPVCGWSDKAFRALTTQLAAGLSLDETPYPAFTPFTTTAQLRNKRGSWHESATAFSFSTGTRTIYRWQKGHAWADVCGREALWK